MEIIAKMRLTVAAVLLMTLIVGLGPMARPLAQSDKGSDKADRPGDDAKSTVSERLAYSVAGVLTAYGNVTVNDNLAPTGTTVLNGSTVATGGDGIASIDLGPRGLIEMRTDTKILLTLPADQIEVDLENCGTLTQSVPDALSAHVKVVNPHTLHIYVTVGAVQVRFGNREDTTTINQFDDKTLDDVSDVTTVGNAVFTIDCNRRPPGAWWIPTSLAGLAALAAGVSLTRDKGPNPVPTPSPITALTPP
jgi:hypothetical protein